MSNDTKVRWGWLKFMYAYTIVVAGSAALTIFLAPKTATSVFGWQTEQPINSGLAASVWLAFAILSIFGLSAPLKFAPILVLQLLYKSIWFLAVVLPLFLTGRFPSYVAFTAALWATFIVGDLIAIPFSHVFTGQPGQETHPAG